MTKKVNTLDHETTVLDAAKVMAADSTFGGYVVILKQGKPIGILTERDIVNKMLAQDLDSSQTKVTEVMSTPLARVDPDDDLLQASKLMNEKQVCKLLVVRDDIIYGIITANAIAQRCSDYVDKSIQDIIRWTAPLGI